MGETSKKQSYLTCAALLAATVAIVKVIGMVYKIPLFNILGDEGTAHFQVTYTIYSLLLTISTAGIPVAMSRLIAGSHALGEKKQISRYFRVGMLVFVPIGVLGMALMLFFPQTLANFMEDPEISLGIMALAPAVLFVCILSVYRGHAQGYSDMAPTAISQIMEVVFKFIFGLSIAWLLAAKGYDTATVSAGAIVGVTIGLGLAIPLMVLYKRKLERKATYPNGVSERLKPVKSTAMEILKISIPITLSSSIMNIISLVDTKLVLSRLQDGAGLDYEMAKVLYGVYSKGITLFNVPSAFITPITVSVVPAIAAALAVKNRKESRSLMESSLKVTNLLAMPMGVGISVLAGPIFQVLFPDSHEKGPMLLAMLGIASIFVCTYLMTTSILQAAGHEKFALLSLPVCGVIKIAVNWVLVGNEAINIAGAPIGNIVCYVAITALNMIYLAKKTENPPSYIKTFMGPAFCSVVMGGAAWGVNGLLSKLGGSFLSGGFGQILCLGAAVVVGVLVYGVLIVVTRTLTKQDVLRLPKGEKIARLLRVK